MLHWTENEFKHFSFFEGVGWGGSGFTSKGAPITLDSGINLSFLPFVGEWSEEMKEAKCVAHCNLKYNDCRDEF